jgi:hypothetical protein
LLASVCRAPRQSYPHRAQCESRDGENVRARMHPEGQADAGREAVQFLSTAVASAAQGSLDRGLSSLGPGVRESRRISPTSWMGRLSAGVIPPRTVAAEACTSNLSRSSLPHICRPGGGDACAACKPLSTTPQVTRRSPGQRLPWRIWVESLIRFRNHVRKVQMDHSLSTTLVILSTRLSASW